jgi:hypothetical protein
LSAGPFEGGTGKIFDARAETWHMLLLVLLLLLLLLLPLLLLLGESRNLYSSDPCLVHTVNASCSTVIHQQVL